MEKEKEDCTKIIPPWKTAPKPVFLVLKDVLLDREVFWKLTGTTVFGFAWGTGVHAVIPWEKLGLALEERRGKFSITNSEISRLQADEGEEAPDVFGPAKPIVLDIERHKFVLRYAEETKQWCVTVLENTLLCVHHLPAGDRQYHQCASNVNGPECRDFCGLKHGDYIKIAWRIHPSEGHKREELVFAFYDHEEAYEEPEGRTLLMMPDTVLPKILASLTPKEYLNGIGLTAPEINETMRKKMPWKTLDLRYTLDGLRTAKMSSAAALCTVTCKAAPPQGICSAAPEPEEFLENFRGLLIGTNLTSLNVWDTRLLHNAPTLSCLKNLNLCLYKGDAGTFKERLGCLENAPIERVQMSAVDGLRGREFFDMLPKATKLHLACYKQEQFWRTSTNAQIASVTHLCIELRGNWWAVSTECPISLMHNLEYLRINEKKPLFSRRIIFGFHERLKTMSFSILTFDEPSAEAGDFWTRVSSAAPNLENLCVVSDEIDDNVLSNLRQRLNWLKRLVLVQTSVSMNGIQDLMKHLPSLEYLRVESHMIARNELPREDFLAHAAPDSTLEWTFVPHVSYYDTRDFDLKFFYTKLAPNEAKQAEQIFKF